MKKFAIILNNEIAYTYEADEKQSFGGPWGGEGASQIEFNPAIKFPKLVDGQIVEDEVRKQDVEAERDRLAKIEAGRKAREACQRVLDLVSGYNLAQELTMEQITQMQQTFELAEKALRAGRPSLAKGAISMIEPDGILVSEEMKQEALDLLVEY